MTTTHRYAYALINRRAMDMVYNSVSILASSHLIEGDKLNGVLNDLKKTIYGDTEDKELKDMRKLLQKETQHDIRLTNLDKVDPTLPKQIEQMVKMAKKPSSTKEALLEINLNE